MTGQTKYQNFMKTERAIADFVPYSSLLTPTTVFTRTGDYLRTYRVLGISFETKDPQDLAIQKDAFAMLLRSIGSEKVSLYVHHIRRKQSDSLHSHFDSDFAASLDASYYSAISTGDMFSNELFLTIIYRPFPTQVKKLLGRSQKRILETLQEEQASALQEFDELCLQLTSGLKKYDADSLTCFEENGALYSETLSFFEYLLTGTWRPVQVPKGLLYDVLGSSWVFVGNETIELRSASDSKFLRILDCKDYPTETFPGVLNGLLYEDYEFIQTQSFSFLDKMKGKGFLERQQKQLLNTEDTGVSQVAEISEALDQITSGEFLLGSYHYSLAIFGDSMKAVEKHTSQASIVLQEQGFLPAIQSIATDAAFYAQLPGNFRYRPRLANITSKNFASLCCFHNFPSGKREKNPWGPAVTMLRTPSLSPFYFNFHSTNPSEDSFDKKALGNTVVIGQSGAGKTVLLSFLLAQAQKFQTNSPLGFTSIFFDKDRGAELAVRALGGKYLTLAHGKPTGLNPFQLEHTETNATFLSNLTVMLVTQDGYSLSGMERNEISRAVQTVLEMDIPRSQKSISLLLQNMTEVEVASRLERWCQGGPLSWVFCQEDTLDFTKFSNYGIDGTSFLDNETTRGPIAYYLLHRMEDVLDGRRFIYIMDEFWKWLQDESFSDFAYNKQKTIRKQNGLGVFATQSPTDVLSSHISREIVEQSATEIYLPNPKADRDDYLGGFKLTESEFELLRSLGEDSRLFLVKQGHHSSIASLNLGGMDDELALLSGSTDNIELFHKVLRETGDNPLAWIPEFQKRRKARVFLSKKEDVS